MSKKSSLLPLVHRYFETDPVAAAHSLESMSEEEAVLVLKSLPLTLIAQTFPHLQINYAATLLKDMPPPTLKGIIEKMDPQLGASLFMHLPQDIRQTFLEQLPPKLKGQIYELLTYPEDSAGRIMSTDYLAFHSDLKVKEAMQKIRALAKTGFPSSYIYVIDPEHHLVGIINMRDLILALPDQPILEIMRTDLFTVHAFTDRETVANQLSSKRYFAVPVVDSENKLLGIVRAEQLIQHASEEAMEDIQKMFGAGGDERAFSPIGFSLRQRLPWLHINLLTAFLAGSVVALFQGVIAKVTALAIFMPVIAGQGGNAGAQSLAVVMRGLVMREIPSAKAVKLIFKEGLIGVINGLAIGLLAALAAWFWQGDPTLGLVVGLAMLTNMIVAGLAGAAIPITMKSIGLDPAQCSNIILTTFTDVMGFFSLLGLAAIFLR